MCLSVKRSWTCIEFDLKKRSSLILNKVWEMSALVVETLLRDAEQKRSQNQNAMKIYNAFSDTG